VKITTKIAIIPLTLNNNTPNCTTKRKELYMYILYYAIRQAEREQAQWKLEGNIQL